MFNVGDTVRFINAQLHVDHPEWYPEVGTIGVVTRNGWVKWPSGSTSGDDEWSCPTSCLELVEAASVPGRPFNAGDKIRGISARYSVTGINWLGYVLEVENYPIIKVCRNSNGVGPRFDVDEACFELVERLEPMRDEDGHIICAECGSIIEDESKLVRIGTGFYCEECVEEHFSKCDHCHTYVRNDNIQEVDDEYVCTNCLETSGDYFLCQVCEEWHSHNNNDGSFSGGGYICESCMRYNGDVVECGDCGVWMWYDDAERDDDEDEYYCPDCVRRNARKAIHNYSYKPDPIFKAGTHDQFYSDSSIKELLFGVELEIDKGSDPGRCAREIIKNTEDIYCKHDGSLNDGVEIVSHPCTLEYHRNSLGWEKICEIARGWNFLSQDANTCGLHIHVGRNQMGEGYQAQDETAGKIVLLIDRHWDSLVKFSRRKAARLDQWASRPSVNYYNVKKYGRSLTTTALNTVDDGRYQAVNLENDATVEFRLFCGTLKPSTIFATLQFVSNLVTYAKDHTPEECMTSKWTDITRVADYPELTEYLKNREIVDGCDPTEYDWKSEPREDTSPVTSRPDDKFRVGDRVRIVNDDGDDVPDLASRIDEEATVAVVYLDNDYADFEYGIVFDEEHDGLHTLYYRGTNITDRENGYSVYGHNLELVTPAA